jgi:chorismate mutase
MLERVITANDLSANDIASAIFTTTTDVNATYPARAARQMGWTHVPLLCMQEMAVADSLPRCIRVLVHWNTDRSPEQIRHVYLGKAQALRPDLAKKEAIEEQTE